MLRGDGKYAERERQEDKQIALVADAMVVTMADIASADGTVTDTELKKMATIYARVTGNQANPERIKTVIDAALAEEDTIEVLLGNIASELDHSDKANIIHAAVLIAYADNDFDISEQSEVWRLAQILGVSHDSLNAIIDRART